MTEFMTFFAGWLLLAFGAGFGFGRVSKVGGIEPKPTTLDQRRQQLNATVRRSVR